MTFKLPQVKPAHHFPQPRPSSKTLGCVLGLEARKHLGIVFNELIPQPLHSSMLGQNEF